MPTLVLHDVPAPLYDQIQRLAEEQKRTPGDVALQVLETVLSEPPLPGPLFLTLEIPAPFTIPRPEGQLVQPKDIVHVADYVPQPHDIDIPGAE